MELGGEPWARACTCHKVFYQPNSYSNHIKTCSTYKKGFAEGLESAKDRYSKKKKQKKGKAAIESWCGDDLDIDREVTNTGDDAPDAMVQEVRDEPQEALLGRGQRVRVPPQRFKDFAATSAIPFEIPMFGLELSSPPRSPAAGSSHIHLTPVSEQRLKVLDASEWKKTRTNGFNLFKSYWTLEDHPHDPDLFLSDSDLQESGESGPAPVKSASAPVSANPYHPFPNWSSFKLGEWYWGDEGGKSRQSFQNLINIVGDDDFLPEDVRHTNWRKIDSMLASSEFDGDFAREDAAWVEDGTSWKALAVSVDVPFNSASNNPGTKPFILDGFRFRPLVPIILAKLRDQRASDHFHLWAVGRRAASPRL